MEAFGFQVVECCSVVAGSGLRGYEFVTGKTRAGSGRMHFWWPRFSRATAWLDQYDAVQSCAVVLLYIQVPRPNSLPLSTPWVQGMHFVFKQESDLHSVIQPGIYRQSICPPSSANVSLSPSIVVWVIFPPLCLPF